MTEHKPEEWRTVPSHPDYEVSNEGGFRRATPGSGTWAGRALKPFPNSGYLKVTICTGKGNGARECLHVLVAEAFLGPRPEGLQIDHIDDDKLNCRAANLEYVTQRENVQRSSKLTWALVHEARAARQAGESCTSIAKRMGVHRNTIRHAITGATWAR